MDTGTEKKYDRRVLIIDDQPAVLKLLHRACELAGYLVESTSSPDTFRSLALTRPDFIIMDLVMPGVDGVELFRFLSENRVKALIILATGSDPRVVQSASRLAESQGLRVLGTLPKPFHVRDVAEILSRDRAKPSENALSAGRPFETGELASAIESGEITPYFQPQIDLHNDKVSGCEGLARWVHPQRGLVMPDLFIPLAEESGLILPLTQCILKLAVRQCRHHDQAGLAVRFSINVSPDCLTDIEFPDQLASMLMQENVRPEEIVIEVTESRLCEDSVKTMDVLTRLRMKGLGLAIDDFGTGYSTFRQLQRFPFNELKIDKQFVLNCDRNAESATIVRTSIELAQRLGIRSVAEGVETLEIADRLRAWGCDLAQGYCYSKALAPQLFFDWVKRRSGLSTVEHAAVGR